MAIFYKNKSLLNEAPEDKDDTAVGKPEDDPAGKAEGEDAGGAEKKKEKKEDTGAGDTGGDDLGDGAGAGDDDAAGAGAGDDDDDAGGDFGGGGEEDPAMEEPEFDEAEVEKRKKLFSEYEGLNGMAEELLDSILRVTSTTSDLTVKEVLTVLKDHSFDIQEKIGILLTKKFAKAEYKNLLLSFIAIKEQVKIIADVLERVSRKPAE